MFRISVRVKASASREKINMIKDSTAVVWVRAKPVQGEANTAVRRVLADRYGIGPSAVRLARGVRSKIKIFEIHAPAQPGASEAE